MKRLIITLVLFGVWAVSPVAFAQGKHVAGSSHFGCVSKDYFQRLVGFAVQKDMEAFKKGLVAGVGAGQCTMFKSGEEVFLTDTAIFSGLVQIRRKGDIVSYWTNIKTVK